jgi:hypothetical protein
MVVGLLMTVGNQVSARLRQTCPLSPNSGCPAQWAAGTAILYPSGFFSFLPLGITGSLLKLIATAARAIM